ncbi:VIT1/CCC1 family protein [Paraburkholderia kirstenboschensis]|uniref:VIT1/CCC1 family protein n=1 Tax=Paraburkholderia kirstenboschensis TaxID=1245436 RepID=UPI003744219F
MASKHEIKRFRTNLSDELNSAALYETLAKVEKDGTRKQVDSDLAKSEGEHAQVWTDKLRANGVRPKGSGQAVKTRLMRTLVHLFGAGFVLPTLAAAEYADRNKYRGQPDAGHMSADEHHHAAAVQTLAHGGGPNMSQGPRIAAAESWHKGVSSGNDLRAAVLGANEGLVSNFCLIMGGCCPRVHRSLHVALQRTKCGLLRIAPSCHRAYRCGFHVRRWAAPGRVGLVVPVYLQARFPACIAENGRVFRGYSCVRNFAHRWSMRAAMRDLTHHAQLKAD